MLFVGRQDPLESSGSSRETGTAGSGSSGEESNPTQTIWGAVAGLRPGRATNEKRGYELAVDRLKKKVPSFDASIPVSFEYPIDRNKSRTSTSE